MKDVVPLTALSKLPNFDPRKVPVDSVDDHLAAVARAALQPEAIRQRFDLPPVWSPEVHAELRFTDRVAVHAAVLVPIVMRAKPMVLLTQRTAHLANHSGQIAFPGGKVDAGDADAAAAALREAHEEVGLDPGLVQVVGELPNYVTGSAFIVSPVIGLVAPEFELSLNAAEVDDVFEVPLEFLMNPANHRHHSLDWQGVRREWLSIPYRDDRAERFIWGATAGMLRNFYRFLAA
ncbi:MAG: CoA pyrophosphatase [Rhodoferax sp.]|nr:CoA pyrophosphatase [Rhodoferax sp.]